MKRVGVLDLNLSELLSAGSTTRAFLLQVVIDSDSRRGPSVYMCVCCVGRMHFAISEVQRMHAYLPTYAIISTPIKPIIKNNTTTTQTQESRYNAALSLSLNFKQLIGDALYRCPLAAREASGRMGMWTCGCVSLLYTHDVPTPLSHASTPSLITPKGRRVPLPRRGLLASAPLPGTGAAAARVVQR